MPKVTMLLMILVCHMPKIELKEKYPNTILLFGHEQYGKNEIGQSLSGQLVMNKSELHN